MLIYCKYKSTAVQLIALQTGHCIKGQKLNFLAFHNIFGISKHISNKKCTPESDVIYVMHNVLYNWPLFFF